MNEWHWFYAGIAVGVLLYFFVELVIVRIRQKRMPAQRAMTDYEWVLSRQRAIGEQELRRLADLYGVKL